MSSFKFNFGVDIPEEESGENHQPVKWLESEEISPQSFVSTVDSIEHASMYVCGDLEIGHVIPNDVLKNMSSAQIVSQADQQHSDLIAGKYEGGLKIWECTRDLIEYLLEDIDETKWKDSDVLDLGCGAGLLGIMALMNGAKVVFQDYNKEVLESVTIPNCLLNLEDEQKLSAGCRFFSGDWVSFDNLLDSSIKFNFILSSETIYNVENYSKIVSVLKRRLKPDGIAFVAAKTYYFGVGGGTKQFVSAVGEHGMKSEVCWTSDGGIQREIIKITL